MTLEVGTDSFVSLEEAQAYFDGRLHSEAWENAQASDQEKALKMATRAISRLPLSGLKASSSQVLAFPRAGEPAEIPVNVKDATCEEALALLDYGDSQRIRLQQQGVQQVSAGKVSEQFVQGASARRLLSPQARDYLRPWLAGSAVMI